MNYNNVKGDKSAYGNNYAPSQYGREGEGLKWTGQEMVHQNYGLCLMNIAVVLFTVHS